MTGRLPERRAVSARMRRAWAVHLGHDPADDVVETLTRGTVPGVGAATGRKRGGALALEVDGVAVTHGELDARAARIAGWLRARGIGRGDRVLLAGASSLELVTAYLGILRAGAVMVPADADSPRADLEHLVADSGAVAAWAGGDALGRLQAMAAPELVASLEPRMDGEADFGAALRDGEPLAPVPQPGDVGVLAYTSGTTGRPKGVPLTHANLLSSIRGAMAAWRWSSRDVLVHALPLSHQHGLSGVHATLAAGSRAHIISRFEPAALAGLVERHRATVLFAVPTMYERLLAWPGLAVADLSSLRLWISGSAALSPALARRVAAALGGLPLERYGSTETGLDVSNPCAGLRRPGAVGLPLPGVEVAVVDDVGAELPPGQEGEVVIRGPQVFAGYWGGGDQADAFLAGGWFRTGDLGRWGPGDGYLEITGRRKEVIVSGGLNVSPREVEAVLQEHASVERVAVVGLPSERWGEEVVAVVVLAPGHALDAGELRRHARERLAVYKCPKRILAAETLPVNRMGKLQRHELVRLIADEALAD